MAMDNARLLVIDHSPECAEEINSLLRNSGIIIRTNFAKSTSEAEKSIKSEPPILIIYNTSAPKSAPVSKILQLADKYRVSAAVRFSPEDPSTLNEALGFCSCIAINSEEDDHLVKAVQDLLVNNTSKLEQDSLQSRLDELQSRYKLLLGSSREPTAYIHEGLHAYANRAYLELLQVEDFSNIEAVSLLEIMSSEKSNLKKLLRDMNQGNYPEQSIRVAINHRGDGQIDAELVFSPARYEGEDCIQMMVQEVDTNALLKGELDRLRRIDPITGLSNRKTFTEVLSQHLEQEQPENEASAVLYIEADGTQDLHTKLGVSSWDGFMADFATAINSCLDEGDIAARFNDNGFTLLLARENKSDLNAVASKLVSSLENHEIEIENHSFSITCSIGFVNIGSMANSSDEIINNSRKAFNQAAVQGNCAIKYKPVQAPVESTQDDLQWIERIRYALDNQDLYSVQQSIVNLEGETEGLFENKTFIREEGHELSADQFLPIAERNDLGATIDRHVIKGLLTTIAGSGDRHIISLSMNSLMDFSFPSWFIHQLEERQVQGSQVVLQLSAPAVEANLKPANWLIDELQPHGCEFSLSGFDDQSNICALLDQLDVSMIKLKCGLTDGLTGNSAHQNIVTNVVHAAEAKQVSVIADGIRDAADLAVLWQCGVKLVAGDFLKESPQVVGQ